MADKICFTGFTSVEKERLGRLAKANDLVVVKSVTRSLAYLVLGPNAGPAKLRDAREQNAIIMNEGQFEKFILTGELPDVMQTEQVLCAKFEQTPRADMGGMGILNLSVVDTPTAIIDFETTGLSAGMDRVVEVSIIRREPSGRSEIVLDTLINPHRPMGATKIHGITDADVADAPAFEEIADGVAKAISGCVLAAYNVYFDMRFFEYEMARAGFALDPPHICLMYLRPLLGLGGRCSLSNACQSHGVPYSDSHMAGDDAEAAAKLFECYLEVMQTEGIRSYQDLSQRGTYKFLRSFDRNVLRFDPGNNHSLPKRLCSRKCRGKVAKPAAIAAASRKKDKGLIAYWDLLKTVVADLQIDEEEVEHLRRIIEEHGLRLEQIRMIHARAFAVVINQFIADKCLDDRESRKLKRLHQCLSKLGWAPGE